MKIKFDVSDRCLAAGMFKDYNDVECSIQESSLATKEAIWLGMNNGGTHTKDHLGNNVCLGRMLLTRKQVKSLIKVLQYFVDHGRLPDGTEQG